MYICTCTGRALWELARVELLLANERLHLLRMHSFGSSLYVDTLHEYEQLPDLNKLLENKKSNKYDYGSEFNDGNL